MNRLRKRWLLVGNMVVVILLLGGACAPQPSPPAAGAPAPQRAEATPATAAPKSGGTLNTYVGGEPGRTDINQDLGVFNIQALAPVHNGLLQFDYRDPGDAEHPEKYQKPIADLATEWSMGGNGLTYTFKLRSGVTWHDGQPLSSADVKFTFGRLKDPPSGILSPFRTLFAVIDTVETPDATTATFKLKQPSPGFLRLVASPMVSVLPKHLLESDPRAMEKKPVGTGPFKFVEWRRGVEVRLEKNKDYFVKGTPYLDGIVHHVIRDAQAQMAALRSGRVDMTGTGTRGLSPPEISLMQREFPDWKQWYLDCGCMEVFWMNMSKPPFEKLEVRKAVLSVLDPKLVIDFQYQGLGKVSGYIAPGQWALSDSALSQWPPYRRPNPVDVGNAKQLLAAAGYPNGFKAKLAHATIAGYERGAIANQTQLRQIGIEVTFQPEEFPGGLYSALGRGNFEMGAAPTQVLVYDPDGYLAHYTSKDPGNYSQGWANPEYDRLFQEQSRTLDLQQRKAITDKMQLMLWENAAAFTNFHRVLTVGYRGYVKGFSGPGQLYDNLRHQITWLDK